MTCVHPYVKRLAPGAFVCLDCGSPIKTGNKVYATGQLEMPPFVFQITEQYWKDRKPKRWTFITRELALKYHWYGTMLYNREYLVMPVLDGSPEPVFYSARCLTECEQGTGAFKGYPPKYDTPKDRKRAMWKSWECGGPPIAQGSLVLVGEGIADAAYLSLIAPSVALLGSHGELRQPFILVLDGDERGINAAFQVVQDAKRAGLVDAKTVTLPPGADPKDVPIKELIEIIYEQTGVRF